MQYERVFFSLPEGGLLGASDSMTKNPVWNYWVLAIQDASGYYVWAKGVSTGVDLALGVSAVAVTGAATGKIGESLGALGVRVLCNVLTSMVVRTPPEIYQEKSLELARRDLTHVEQQLQNKKVIIVCDVTQGPSIVGHGGYKIEFALNILISDAVILTNITIIILR